MDTRQPYDKKLYDKVSVWLEAHRQQMIEDIMRLVRIPSVSEPKQDKEAPFGEGCRACLEEMLAIGREHGFHTENYGNRMGSIGEADKDWEHMIGFWNHLDVVPVGNQWTYPPFDPVVREPFLIGRGSQDNKGPAVGILYVMEALRELGIPLKHQLCLFVGCDEERGMEDLEYYTAHYPTPKLSMIADCGFPVCYGEKGIVEGNFHSEGQLSEQVLEFAGGNASNMIPDEAFVVLAYSEELEQALVEKGVFAESGSGTVTAGHSGDTIRIQARGESRHSAFPDGSMNAIHELADFLAGLDVLPQADRALFGRLSYLSQEYYGEHTQIAYSDEASGRTTCAATVLGMAEGRVTLHFNIRYAISTDQEKMLAGLERTAEENSMRWELIRNSAPNYFPREHPAVDLLTDLYNEITGSNKECFVMGGGTYARKLPHAFAYGLGGMEETQEDKRIRSELFLPGHGGAHEPDEGLNLRLLMEGMKIYAMAVVALNECEL